MNHYIDRNHSSYNAVNIVARSSGITTGITAG